MGYREVIMGTSGLQGYWRFGESNDTAGVVSEWGPNGIFPSTRPNLNQAGALVGDTNTCYRFASSNNDYIYFPGNYYNYQGTATFSMELWYQPTLLPSSGFMAILSKARYDAQASGYELFVDGLSKRLKFTRVTHDGNKTMHNGPIVSVGNWYHIVITYEGSNQRMYVNGSFATSVADSSSMKYNTLTNIYVGRTAMGGEYLSGYVDELAFYNSQLLTPTIQAHYNAATNPVNPVYGAVNYTTRFFFSGTSDKKSTSKAYPNMDFSTAVAPKKTSFAGATFDFDLGVTIDAGVSAFPTHNAHMTSGLELNPTKVVSGEASVEMRSDVLARIPTLFKENHDVEQRMNLDIEPATIYSSNSADIDMNSEVTFTGMSRIELDELFQLAAKLRSGAIHFAVSRLTREHTSITHTHEESLEWKTVTPFIAFTDNRVPKVIGTATVEWFISRITIDATTRVHSRPDLMEEFNVTEEVLG